MSSASQTFQLGLIRILNRDWRQANKIFRTATQKISKCAFFAVMAAAACLAGCSRDDPETATREEVKRRISSTVVRIDTGYQTPSVHRPPNVNSGRIESGFGVIVASEGLILTHLNNVAPFLPSSEQRWPGERPVAVTRTSVTVQVNGAGSGSYDGQVIATRAWPVNLALVRIRPKPGRSFASLPIASASEVSELISSGQLDGKDPIRLADQSQIERGERGGAALDADGRIIGISIPDDPTAIIPATVIHEQFGKILAVRRDKSEEGRRPTHRILKISADDPDATKKLTEAVRDDNVDTLELGPGEFRLESLFVTSPVWIRGAGRLQTRLVVNDYRWGLTAGRTDFLTYKQAREDPLSLIELSDLEFQGMMNMENGSSTIDGKDYYAGVHHALVHNIDWVATSHTKIYSADITDSRIRTMKSEGGHSFSGASFGGGRIHCVELEDSGDSMRYDGSIQLGNGRLEASVVIDSEHNSGGWTFDVGGDGVVQGCVFQKKVANNGTFLNVSGGTVAYNEFNFTNRHGQEQYEEPKRDCAIVAKGRVQIRANNFTCDKPCIEWGAEAPVMPGGFHAPIHERILRLPAAIVVSDDSSISIFENSFESCQVRAMNPANTTNLLRRIDFERRNKVSDFSGKWLLREDLRKTHNARVERLEQWTRKFERNGGANEELRAIEVERQYLIQKGKELWP